MSKVIYRPRGDFVLFRLVDQGQLRGIAIPGISEQAKFRIVEAIGPEVEDLNVGDSVLVIGTLGQDVVPLPNEGNLYLTRASNVTVVLESEDDE